MTRRRGSTLIVVAGISALFMLLCLTFINRMRADGEESRLVQQEVQARIMLNAALHYIQESSRLGWDLDTTPEHEEAYGWLDVRDSQPGPRDRLGRALVATDYEGFPNPGYAARCPMYVLQRPPWAISLTYAYNPLPQDAALGWAELISHKESDPQPPRSVVTYAHFRDGDLRPRQDSLDRAWFRVFREPDDPLTPQDERATFLITCGAGATQGFRDWDEVESEEQEGLFGGEKSLFQMLRNQERLLFYRVEWHSGVGGSAAVVKAEDSYEHMPMNDVDDGWWAVRSFAGSFLYIQRLDHQPTGTAW